MAVPVVVLLVMGVAWVMAYARVRSTREWVAHTHQVLEASERVMTDLSQAEAGQRGYLVTGRESYLEPYQSGLARLPRDTAELRRLTLDNPRQQARLDVLRPLIALRLGELAETLQLRRSRGQAPAQNLIESDRGRTLMEESHRLLTDVQKEEGQLLEARMATETFRARLLLALVVVGLLLVAASILLVNGLLVRYGEAQEAALRHIGEQNEELSTQRDALEESASELEIINEELLDRTRAAEEANEATAVEHRRVVALHDLTVALSGAARFADVAAVAGSWGRAALGADSALVTLLSETGDALEPVHASGVAEDMVRRWPRIPLGTPAVVTEAARRGEVVYASSAAVRQGRPIGLLMGTPLMVLTAAVIVIGFWPGIVDWITGPAASSLVGMFAGQGMTAN